MLGVGTWRKIDTNRVLQSSSDTNKAGSLIEAGLPNVTGGFWNLLTSATQTTGLMGSVTGSFYIPFKENDACNSVMESVRINIGNADGIGLDASLSNSIYGKSDTVQPPAFVVDVWRRIA